MLIFLSYINLSIDCCNITLNYETENLFCHGAKCSRDSTKKPEEKYSRKIENFASCTDCFKNLKNKNLTAEINNENKLEFIVSGKFGRRSLKYETP